jgi:hypothetical protein
MTAYSLLLDRVEGLAAELPTEERGYAERVVQLCHELAARARSDDGKLLLDAGDLDRKRELGRLSELLGRRATKALPAASLGRAALADLSIDLRSFEAVCADCDRKLTLLGR